MQRPLLQLSFLAAITATAGQGAFASTRPATLDDLCAAADALVIAEVTSQEVVWDPTREGTLVTRTWAHVQRSLKGTAPESVEIVLPGGERDGLRLYVEDTPSLRIDERYVLFLRKRTDGTWGTVGGELANTLVQRPRADPANDTSTRSYA